MRHGKKINHLGRQKGHRDAMLSNMAASLILNKRINTTVAKAKALRGYVEPLITRSKEDTTHSRRMVFRYLGNKTAVAELFRDVAPKVAERPGGYTRIIRLENRLGDNAEMCMMELVDFNELLLGAKEGKKAKTTRRGRSKKATATAKETSADTASETEASAEDTKTTAKPKKAAAKKKKSDEKKDEE
jgi:large subunit ribosomal protein L17